MCHFRCTFTPAYRPRSWEVEGALMPASCNEDDVEGGELRACSMASEVLLFLLVKQMPVLEQIRCHQACWLQQLLISSKFGFEICSSKDIPGVLTSSTMCGNLSPCGFPCSQRDDTPNTSHPLPAQARTQQVLPSSMGREHQHSPEASEIPGAGTEGNKQ